MIIQIRGTSGSGKSTVMKRVMDACSKWEPIMSEKRKKPIYYVSKDPKWPRTVVLGHYESPCGGCDTIGSAPQVFDWIETVSKIAANKFILCEGLLLSEDTKWSSQLKDLRIVFLTTPLQSCLSRIEGRRAAVGNEKPLNPANTSNRVAVIERARVKLSAQGILCRRASSDQAPKIICDWLGVPYAFKKF